MSRWLKFVLFCNLIVIACTVFASWAPAINPSTFSGLAYFGLAFPYLIFLNLFFFIYWISQKKWLFILPILTYLCTQTAFKQSFAHSLTAKVEKLDKELKVMSYNVRNFDLYNWKSNTDSRDEMLSIIEADNPDVVCFQEFFTMERPNFQNIAKMEKLGYPFVHLETTTKADGGQEFGLATFSKYPISNKGQIRFDNAKNNLVAQSDIDVNGKSIRIYNAHLQSIHLSNKDYALFEQEAENTMGSMVSVFKKLRRGFINRASQADILSGSLKESTIPKLLCGDFNDVPVSYTYRTLSSGMKDAYLESGFGLGGTYAGSLPIILRIDYLMVDPEINIKDFEVIHEGNSDHFPISAVIEF